MVTPAYYPVKGGTETVVRNLSIMLNKINVHTDVMTFNMERKWNPKWQGKKEEIDGITVFRIPGLNWLPIAHDYRYTFGVNLIPSKFTGILKDYDLIHFHELDFSFPLFSCLIRKPKIIHLHGAMDFSRSTNPKMSARAYGPITCTLFKYLPDFYFVITKRMMDDVAVFGIPKEKIVYFPNAVDTELFRPVQRKEENLLLFVGRISSGKGLHVLLEALNYLKNPVRLVIIGPSGQDITYHQRFLRRIENENLKGKNEVKYLGAMEQADIVEWYQKASICILPSFWEGFPIVILEALSCETPVVATSVGGVPDVIQNYQNGILIPPNAPQELARAIDCLTKNKDLRNKMGREGRKRIIREFSLRVTVKKLKAIYQSILSS